MIGLRVILPVLVGAALVACGSPAPSPPAWSTPSAAPQGYPSVPAPTASAPSAAATPVVVQSSPASPTPLASSPRGLIRVACDQPEPSVCLREAAYGISILSENHGPVATVLVAFISLCGSASTCTSPPHEADDWTVITFASGSPPVAYRVVNVMDNRRPDAGLPGQSPPGTQPTPFQYAVACDSTFTERACLGAAAAGADRAPRTTPQLVTVKPAPKGPCPSGQDCPFIAIATFTYADSRAVPVRVTPGNSLVGWISLPS